MRSPMFFLFAALSQLLRVASSTQLGRSYLGASKPQRSRRPVVISSR